MTEIPTIAMTIRIVINKVLGIFSFVKAFCVFTEYFLCSGLGSTNDGDTVTSRAIGLIRRRRPILLQYYSAIHQKDLNDGRNIRWKRNPWIVLGSNLDL